MCSTARPASREIPAYQSARNERWSGETQSRKRGYFFLNSSNFFLNFLSLLHLVVAQHKCLALYIFFLFSKSRISSHHFFASLPCMKNNKLKYLQFVIKVVWMVYLESEGYNFHCKTNLGEWMLVRKTTLKIKYQLKTKLYLNVAV